MIFSVQKKLQWTQKNSEIRYARVRCKNVKWALKSLECNGVWRKTLCTRWCTCFSKLKAREMSYTYATHPHAHVTLFLFVVHQNAWTVRQDKYLSVITLFHLVKKQPRDFWHSWKIRISVRRKHIIVQYCQTNNGCICCHKKSDMCGKRKPGSLKVWYANKLYWGL